MSLQISTALFELLFIFTVLAALCHQRERIGVAPFTMAFGAMMFFGTLMSAAEVYAKVPWGWSFNVAQVSVFLPLLAAFLMTFITLGVLKAQRLLLGAMGAFLLYIYFSMLIKIQCSQLPPGPLRDVVYLLLSDGTASVNLSAVSNLISYITVPVIYSVLPLRVGRTFRIITAIEAALVFGMIPETVLCWINGNWRDFNWQSMVIVAAVAPVVGFALSFYVSMLEKELPDTKTRALDFIFAFFGSYSRVKELENDLSNWANRYHLILRHTAEMVVMTDGNGLIQEMNIAAGKIFGSRSASSLIGKNLFDMLENVSGNEELCRAVEHPVSFSCSITAADGGEKILAGSLSPVRMGKKLLLVLVARDITGEVTLAREKEELAEQLMHSQRMESLGMLAGGIAHDFNNCIHAIMGHADVVQMLYANDPEKISSHLNKISSIAEKAGKLTSQLLGFARKGKYNVVDIDLASLLEESTGLLDPFRTRGVDINCSFPAENLVIRGDQLQLQQVVLNLLINALDATAGNSGEMRIDISAGKAAESPLKFTPPVDFADASEEDYLYFSIRDNGSGIDDETAKKIFEPFFTTKPIGSGTGMGLAMVYGTITHHRGWIQLKSAPGTGTLFCFFLPRADK